VNGLPGKAVDLVAQITTWKRAFIILALGAGGLFGALLWQHPQWVEDAANTITGHKPVMMSAAQISGALPRLRRVLDARVVIVIGADPGRNEQWLVAYDIDQSFQDRVQPLVDTRWKSVMPMFTGDQNEMLVRIMGGEILCTTLENEVIRVAKLLDLKMICATGIPPGPEALVGYIAAGFATPGDRAELTRVRTILRRYGEDWAQ
jgi:hypothetical protein